MMLKAYQAGPVTKLSGALGDTAAMSHYVDINNITSIKVLISTAQNAGPLTLTSDAAASTAVLDTLRNYLSQRKPVVMLIDYCKLSEKPFHPPRYLRTGATSVDHWWVVVGTDGDNFVINDPLWLSADNGHSGGADMRISGSDLQGAYAGNLLVPADPLP
jgi:hypothetical protein